jgi:hypothetical protein
MSDDVPLPALQLHVAQSDRDDDLAGSGAKGLRYRTVLIGLRRERAYS